MGKNFEKTMEIVNSFMKPGVQFLRDSGDDTKKLIAEALSDQVEMFEDIAVVMNDDSRKVALFENGLLPQMFYAFDCAPLCLETFPPFYSNANIGVVHEFLDAAQESGLSSDICSTDRFILGAALRGELPNNSFFVSSTSPCDGTRLVYPMIQKIMASPICFIEAPYTYGREAAQWFGKQIKAQLIPFLEKVTGKSFDIDKFREVTLGNPILTPIISDDFDYHHVG